MTDKYPMWAFPQPFREAVWSIVHGAERDNRRARLRGVVHAALPVVPQRFKVRRDAPMPSPEALDLLRNAYEKANPRQAHMWAEDITEVITRVHHGHQQGDTVSPTT